MTAISIWMNPFSYFEFMPTVIEAQTRISQLANTYNFIYFRSLLQTLADNDATISCDDDDGGSGGSNYVSNFYNKWLRHTDKELARELRSCEFISALSSYLNSLVDLHSLSTQIGLSVGGYSYFFDLPFDLHIYNLRLLSLHPAKESESTPHSVVYRKRNARLLHYYGINEEGQYNTGQPLLIIYAPINKIRILDLNKQRSVVRNLLSHGLDVYMLDWGDVQKEDYDLSLDDYLGYIQDAIHTIKSRPGDRSEKVSILAYCWGGVIALVYSSLCGNDSNNVANNDVKSLALMATPVDFDKDDTLLATWSRAIDVDKMMDEFRHLGRYFIDCAFLMRNPPRYAFDKYLKFFEKQYDSEYVKTFIDVERWLYNTPPIPGKLYSQIINGCYRNNLFAPNKMEMMTIGNESNKNVEVDGDGDSDTKHRRIIASQKIDLGKITIPVLSIITEKDDLVTSKSSLAVNDWVSSKDKTVFKNPDGHVAMCISDNAHEKLWPEVAKWILSKR